MQWSLSQNTLNTNEQHKLDARTFAELESYIEYQVEVREFIFKFSELHNLFENQLKDLGIEKTVNKSRLKNQIQHILGYILEQTDSRNMLLVFSKWLKKLIKEAVALRDYTAEAISMTKMVNMEKKCLSSILFDFLAVFHPTAKASLYPQASSH